MRFLPPSATPLARLILITRGMRSVADGCISVLLPAYLLALGFDAVHRRGRAVAIAAEPAARRSTAAARRGYRRSRPRWSGRRCRRGSAPRRRCGPGRPAVQRVSEFHHCVGEPAGGADRDDEPDPLIAASAPRLAHLDRGGREERRSDQRRPPAAVVGAAVGEAGGKRNGAAQLQPTGHRRHRLRGGAAAGRSVRHQRLARRQTPCGRVRKVAAITVFPPNPRRHLVMLRVRSRMGPTLMAGFFLPFVVADAVVTLKVPTRNRVDILRGMADRTIQGGTRAGRRCRIGKLVYGRSEDRNHDAICASKGERQGAGPILNAARGPSGTTAHCRHGTLSVTAFVGPSADPVVSVRPLRRWRAHAVGEDAFGHKGARAR